MKLKYANEAADFDAVIDYQLLETKEGSDGFKKGFLKAQIAIIPFSFVVYLSSSLWGDGSGISGLVALVLLEALLFFFGKKLSSKAVKLQQKKSLDLKKSLNGL